MSITLTQPKTAADYARLPEGTPIQLIAGEFITSPSPLTEHQNILGNFFLGLSEIVRRTQSGQVYLSPLDVYLSDEDIYQPDIFFVSNERLSGMERNGMHGAPDLVVEVLSPSTAHYDLRDKKDAYEKFGVKEYWIIDPMESSVELFKNSNGKFETVFLGKTGKVSSILLPEFTLSVEEIFPKR